jgi:hypothetical protein
MTDFDELIGRWHELADHANDNDNGMAHFNQSNKALVAEVRKICLGDTEDVDFNLAQDFLQYVIELRQNEKSWSRRLGEVMIRAQDQLDAGNPTGARTTFDEFETQCPWINFLEIAKDQRHCMQLD